MDDDDSIAGRTQKLRQDIELLLQEEWRYRRSRTHSLADNNEHDKRKARLVAIREELRILVEKTNRQASHGSVWYSNPRSNTSTGSLRMLHPAIRKRESEQQP